MENIFKYTEKKVRINFERFFNNSQRTFLKSLWKKSALIISIFNNDFAWKIGISLILEIMQSCKKHQLPAHLPITHYFCLKKTAKQPS